LAEIFLRVGQVDSYLSFHKPWLIAKEASDDSRKKLIEVLYTAAEAIRFITAYLHPVLPYATSKVWAQLGLGDIEQAAKNGELKNLTWGGLRPGTKIGAISPIFPRADKELIVRMNDLEQSSQPATSTPSDAAQLPPTTPPIAAPAAAPTAPIAAPAAAPAQITIDDFIKIELRVAEIKIAERIPKSDKLLRLEVDLGPLGTRQVLAGIAEHYDPATLVGRRCIIVANLAPRKMRGLESHGMLLAASLGDGDKPAIATFLDDIALGARVR